MKQRSLSFLFFGLLAASGNLYLSYHFHVNSVDMVFQDPKDMTWFFIGEPVYNWGGFFVDGTEPTIHRLPSTLFLVWLSISLCRYLMIKRTFFQSLFAALLLGGVGGLTLDILAYGSVCDWLGFRVPMAPVYSMTNISDLMILVSAPVASIICVKNVIGRIIAICVAIAIIGANTFYHFAALYHLTMFY
jgi:lipoprotein signal peptidase